MKKRDERAYVQQESGSRDTVRTDASLIQSCPALRA